MQLKSGVLLRAPEVEDAVPVGMDRTAGVIALLGCIATIIGAFLPWALSTAFAVSFVKMENQSAPILLGVLTLIASAVAVVGLLQRPPTAAIATIVMVLGVGQLGLALWDASNIMHALASVDSREILIRAIGTGVYACVLGALAVLAGGVMAWRRRAEPKALETEGDGIAWR